MSYGIVRIQKFTAGSVRGIQAHDRREKDHSNTNKDIDYEKTKYNYALKETEDGKSFRTSVNERIAGLNLKKAVRKDAIVMTQCLVTSDEYFFKNLSQEQQRDFFSRSYQWLKKRYGQENMISAIVHMDEKTPHMHVNFVPVTPDGRLCAKDLFKRKDLSLLHDDFYKDIGKGYGLERGETRDEKQNHLSVEDYKKKTIYDASVQADAIVQDAKITVAENLNKMHEDINSERQRAAAEAAKLLSEAHKEAQDIIDNLIPLRAEYEARKAFIEQSIKDSRVSVMYPDYVKINKSLLGKETVTVPKDKWEAKHVSANQIDALRKEREVLENSILSFKNSEPVKKIRSLEDELMQLRAENRELSLELYKANKNNEKVNLFFEKHPDIKKAFFEAENALMRQSKRFDIER